MSRELSFIIDALNIDTPIAKVYDGSRIICEINLVNQIHLWPNSLVIAGYRLYFTGLGQRNESFNVSDGIVFLGDVNDSMVELGLSIIKAVCRTDDLTRSNVLRKMQREKFTLLRRNAKGVELHVTGRFDKPYYFLRTGRNGPSSAYLESYEEGLKCLSDSAL